MKPILFNTEMVQAILRGQKTQTRREIPNSIHFVDITKTKENNFIPRVRGGGAQLWKEPPVFPKYQIGDILYVRETFCEMYDTENHPEIDDNPIEKWSMGTWYKADGKPSYFYDKWKPSIHMPKEAARIFLKVIGVRVERLQDISEDDAHKEGVLDMFGHDPELAPTKAYFLYGRTQKEIKTDHWGHVADNAIESFLSLWKSIYGKESLSANPFVWVYDFERTDKPEESS